MNLLLADWEAETLKTLIEQLLNPDYLDADSLLYFSDDNLVECKVCNFNVSIGRENYPKGHDHTCPVYRGYLLDGLLKQLEKSKTER